MAPASFIIHATSAERGMPHIAYACPLGPDTLLCFGLLDYELSADVSIHCGDAVVQKPYIGTLLNEKGERWLLMLLHFDRALSSIRPGIVFTRHGQRVAWRPETDQTYDAQLAYVDAWAESLSPASLRRALWLLLRASFIIPGILHPLLARACHALRRHIREETPMGRMRWLLPDMFGFECTLPASAQMQLLAITTDTIASAPIVSKTLDTATHEGFARFETEIPPHAYLTLFWESGIHFIANPPAYNLPRPVARNRKKHGDGVLTIAHNHPSSFAGGTEIFSHCLHQHLQVDNVRSAFLSATRAQGGACMQVAAEHEFTMHCGGFDHFLHSAREPELLQEGFADFLRERNPAVVHFHHTLGMGMEMLSAVKSILPYARIVYTLHDFMPLCHQDGQMVKTGGALCERATPGDCTQCFPALSPGAFEARDYFIRRHFALVDAFISPSEFLARRYREWGMDAKRMHVIRHGFPPVEPTHAKKKKLHARFAYFGQITPYKGVELLLKAAHILHRKKLDFTLDIYGHMQHQALAFQEQLQALLAACPASVRYQGAYTPEKLPQLMAESGWVVAPSTWWENAPLVIDEALAHSRPVICTGIGGMAEKITHEKNGLHFAHGDARALADTMERAITTPALWQKLRAHIFPPPSMESCVKAHRALYNAL